MPIDKHSLTEKWELTHFQQATEPDKSILNHTDQYEWIAAEVPGNVVLDLHRAGQVKDPLIGRNPEPIRPLEFHEWWYRTEFSLPRALHPEETLRLVFEGIDTFSEIYLDGALLGTTNNMFIPHGFPLNTRINDAERHTLLVRIKSDQYSVSNCDFDGVVDLVGSDPSRAWIRKAAYTHGWDIFPRLLSAGIWKPVQLHYVPNYYLEDVFIFTGKFDPHCSTVTARVSVATPAIYRNDLSVRVRVCDETGEIYSQTFSMQFPTMRFPFEVHNPKLWWPRPHGEPHLYQAIVELLCDDEELDQWQGSFGIRSIEVVQEPSNKGDKTFFFKINDTPISIYGTNHVPLDSFPSRIQSRLQPALELLDESGCNMVRMWGGGLYDTTEFYDACDRLGILIWQDFMFSCALYPQTKDFLDQVAQEARHVIRSIRNHPSLVLYCGDNEIETHFSEYFSPHQLGGNRAIAHNVLPECVLRHDGTRPYWPSSPYTGMEGEKPSSVRGGDTHIWCHGLYYKDPIYCDDKSPFISEIGHMAFPNLESLQRFIPEKDLWPRNSTTWGYRSGCLNDPLFYGYPHDRLNKMDKNIVNVIGILPDNLNDLIFASQFVQAEAYKCWIERARIRKFACGGILWWNLLDGCPQASDAIVDYYFSKKLAFSYVRRVQTDLLICIEPKGEDLQCFIINDRPTPQRVDYTITCADVIINENDIVIEANQSVSLGTIAKSSRVASLYLIESRCETRRYFNYYLDGAPPLQLSQIYDYADQIERAASMCEQSPDALPTMV